MQTFAASRWRPPSASTRAARRSKRRDACTASSRASVGAVEHEPHLPRRRGPHDERLRLATRRAPRRPTCSSPCAGRRRGRAARPWPARTSAAPRARRRRSCPTSSARPYRRAPSRPRGRRARRARRPCRGTDRGSRAPRPRRARGRRAPPPRSPRSPTIIRPMRAAWARRSGGTVELDATRPSASSTCPFAARLASATITASEAACACSVALGARARARAASTIASGVAAVRRNAADGAESARGASARTSTSAARKSAIGRRRRKIQALY